MWGVITGAGRGLGRGLAEAFAQSGFSLILHARDAQALADTEAICRSFGVKTKCISGDLQDPSVLNQIINQANSLECGLLINNAGAPCPGKALLDIKSAEIDELIKVNLEIPIKLTHGIWSVLGRSPKSCVININSMMGIEPKLNRSIYSAVRFGLRGFTEALALEGQKLGVRVFGVYPTRIRSRPEYEYGFEVNEVVERILNFYKGDSGTSLVLDGRPK